MGMFFTGTLTDASVKYLQTLTQASPIEGGFFQRPVVYLSAPQEDVDLNSIQSAQELVGQTLPLAFVASDALFNSSTNRTELDVFLKVAVAATARDPRQSLLPLKFPNPAFTPYFSWLIDPNRSRRSRSYVVNLANSMFTDQFRFEVTIGLSASTDPLGLVFNQATLNSARLNGTDPYNDRFA